MEALLVRRRGRWIVPCQGCSEVPARATGSGPDSPRSARLETLASRGRSMRKSSLRATYSCQQRSRDLQTAAPQTRSSPKARSVVAPRRRQWPATTPRCPHPRLLRARVVFAVHAARPSRRAGRARHDPLSASRASGTTSSSRPLPCGRSRRRIALTRVAGSERRRLRGATEKLRAQPEPNRRPITSANVHSGSPGYRVTTYQPPRTRATSQRLATEPAESRTRHCRGQQARRVRERRRHPWPTKAPMRRCDRRLAECLPPMARPAAALRR